MTDTHHRMPSESIAENSIYIAQLFGIKRNLANMVLMNTAFRVPADHHYWINEQKTIAYIHHHRTIQDQKAKVDYMING